MSSTSGLASLSETRLDQGVSRSKMRHLVRTTDVHGEAKPNAGKNAARCQALARVGMLATVCGRVTNARMLVGKSRVRKTARRSRVASGSLMRRETSVVWLATSMETRTAQEQNNAWLRTDSARRTHVLHSGKIADRPSVAAQLEVRKA